MTGRRIVEVEAATEDEALRLVRETGGEFVDDDSVETTAEHRDDATIVSVED
jgi:hypothetical protein